MGNKTRWTILVVVVVGVLLSVTFIAVGLSQPRISLVVLGVLAGNTLLFVAVIVVMYRAGSISSARLDRLSKTVVGTGEAARRLDAEVARLGRSLTDNATRVDESVTAVREAVDRAEARGVQAELAALSAYSRADSSFDAIADLKQRLGRGGNSIQEAVRGYIARELSAQLSLHRLVSTPAGLPASTVWTATSETLLTLVSEALKLPDGSVIVETGSGLSTVWLALAIAQSGRDIKLVSLEHSEAYRQQTQDALASNDVLRFADVRYAPLEVQEIDGESYSWYSSAGYDDLDRIDLLFVDGPPAATGHKARFPAVPRLKDAMVDSALIVLDDTDREDEKEIVEEWIAASNNAISIEGKTDRATLLRVRRG